MKQGYRRIMHHQAFMQNLSANLINRIGDSIDMLAFSWLAYALTNSAGWSAIVLGVNLLPNILIQPIAGAIVEQREKKQVMVFCDLVRGVLTGCIMILYLCDVLYPWILLVITFFNNTLEAFRNPAQTGFIPKILPKEDYDFGLSLNQSSARACELIGTGLAGIILSSIGISAAVMIDMVTFFISAWLIAHIHIEEETIQKKEKLNMKLRVYMQDLKEGYHYLKETQLLFSLAIIACLMNMTLVPLNSFEVPYINGILKAPAYMLSLQSIALSIGIGIGSFLYPYLHKRIKNKTLLGVGGIVSGIYYLSLVWIARLSFFSIINIAIVFSGFIFGLFAGVMCALTNIAFMSRVKSSYISRASAIFSAIAIAGMPILSFLLSVMCHIINVLDIFQITGIFTILLFVGMMFLKTLRDL